MTASTTASGHTPRASSSGYPSSATSRCCSRSASTPARQDDLAALRRHGWQLTDPAQVASTPSAYRNFVQGSLLELGIAKHGYVASGSGWFSDRSVCYLASGRPVVAQDTGFSSWLPTGAGLLSFRTADEAASALDEVAGDYERHRRAARTLAEDVFDSDRVLGELLACL